MPPAISVVVCIYNVERYLRECLDSIAAQSFTDFEAILCDDESTDASGLIAKHFAAADERFKYVHQQNRGPGPAGGRNGAIPHITGDWILFMDSDDILLPLALETLYETVQSTGSELAIGGVDRFNESNRWPSFLHQPVHTEQRLATSVDEFPDMVWDSTAWNKLISTRLWNEHIKFFDEGRLYEDLYPMIRLMCLANSVDIVDETVYLWRDREARNSVTQQVASSRGLIDKVDQMLKLNRFLEDTGNATAKRAQDIKLLTADIVWMLDDLDRGDEDYQTAFWAEVPALVEVLDQAERAALPPQLITQYDLICAGDKAGLAACRRELSGRQLTPGKVREAHAGGEAGDLVELFGRISSVRFDGPTLVLAGSVALDRVRARRSDLELTTWFESRETGRRVEFGTTLSFRPRLHLTRQGPQLHRWTGFEIRIDGADLLLSEAPVGNVMVGASLHHADGRHGSGRLRISRSQLWTAARDVGSCSVIADRDHLGHLSLNVSAPSTYNCLQVEDGVATIGGCDIGAEVSLFDAELGRRWSATQAERTPGNRFDARPSSVGLDLSSIPNGLYKLEALRQSPVFPDGWVPMVGAADTTGVYEVGDRVMRWHVGTASTVVEIANTQDEFISLTTSKVSTLDARLTEAARQVNKYTWI